MGEIGIMVSRLQQEGFDLEDMIDEELRAAGFLELCERCVVKHELLFPFYYLFNLGLPLNSVTIQSFFSQNSCLMRYFCNSFVLTHT